MSKNNKISMLANDTGMSYADAKIALESFESSIKDVVNFNEKETINKSDRKRQIKYEHTWKKI